MDIGTSGVKAVLVNEAGAIVATAARGLRSRIPRRCGRAGSDAWVDAADRRHRPRVLASARGARCVASVSPARCTALPCSARTAVRCVRPSCGMMAGPMPSARGSRSAVPRSTPSPAISRCRASPRQSCSGWPPRAGDFRAGGKSAAAKGLRALPPDRRDGRGHVGRRRHALARCRSAPLV